MLNFLTLTRKCINKNDKNDKKVTAIQDYILLLAFEKSHQFEIKRNEKHRYLFNIISLKIIDFALIIFSFNQGYVDLYGGKFSLMKIALL